ncbi:MAG TPA: GNAT family N-acetyltransferase [Planctomycetaceae bacterium]
MQETILRGDISRSFKVAVPVVVRPCAAVDLPRLEWCGLFTPHREIIRAAYEAQVRGEQLMLVADVNGFPIGQVWVDLFRKREESVGVIWALRVVPFMQRLGLGTRLLAAAEGVLRRRRFKQAELGVEKSNPSAAKLYERLGYVRVGESQEEYSYKTPDGQFFRVPQDLWVYRKTLAGRSRPSRRPREAARGTRLQVSPDGQRRIGGSSA